MASTLLRLEDPRLEGEGLGRSGAQIDIVKGAPLFAVSTAPLFSEQFSENHTFFAPQTAML